MIYSLQVNVFELGHTYLQLVQTLNLRLPLVDPSHYISRFSALLEFGDETHKVATDAVRLVQRFDRDWMTKGRRPAGICGAALLLAARMNNFRRSTEEIVQVVKIADTTLKRRLEEFKLTPSGRMTVGDFRTAWLDDEMDPPAFTKGKERDERTQLEAEVEEEAKEEGGTESRRSDGRKRKRRRLSTGSGEDSIRMAQEERNQRPDPIDPALLGEGILADRVDEDEEEQNDLSPSILPPVTEIDATVHAAVTEEVSQFLHSDQGASLSSALDEADERRMTQHLVVDELLGLDEEELDRFILSEAEVQIKERVWVEINKEYLEAIAAKGEERDFEASAKTRKRRKSGTKPRDTSTPAGLTAADSVRNLLKKNPKYSKRINYDALKDMFVAEEDRKNEHSMYTLDEKEDQGIGEEDGGSDQDDWNEAYEQEV